MLEKSIRMFTGSTQIKFNLFNKKNINILEAS